MHSFRLYTDIGQTHRQTDVRTDGRTDEQTDGRTELIKQHRVLHA